MKRVVGLFLAAATLAACDRPDNTDKYSAYDPKYDGVATQAPPVDPSILDPQKQGAPAATPSAAATSAPAASAPASQAAASEPATEPATAPAP